jgi:hypothetical protein
VNENKINWGGEDISPKVNDIEEVSKVGSIISEKKQKNNNPKL